MRKILHKFGIIPKTIEYKDLHDWLSNKINSLFKQQIKENSLMAKAKRNYLQKELSRLNDADFEKQLVPAAKQTKYFQYKTALNIMINDIVEKLDISEKPLKQYNQLKSINEYIYNNEKNLNKSYYAIKEYNSIVEKIYKLIINIDHMAANAREKFEKSDIEDIEKIYSLILQVNNEMQTKKIYENELNDLKGSLQREIKKLNNQKNLLHHLNQKQANKSSQKIKSKYLKTTDLKKEITKIKKLIDTKKLSKAQNNLMTKNMQLKSKHITSFKAIEKKFPETKSDIENIIIEIKNNDKNMQKATSDDISIQKQMIKRTEKSIANLNLQIKNVENSKERLNPKLVKQKIRNYVQKIDPKIKIII